MRTIYIMGESHTESLGWRNDEFGSEDTRFLFRRIKAKTAWNLHYEIEEIDSFDPSENVLYMPALGEVDIRFHLYAKNNTEEVVSNYVKRSVEKFGKNNVRFMGPVPPSSMELYPNEFKGSVEDRYKIFEQFMFFLNSYSSFYGLEKPIDIRDAVGMKAFPDSYYREDGYHLSPEPQKFILYYLLENV